MEKKGGNFYPPRSIVGMQVVKKIEIFFSFFSKGSVQFLLFIFSKSMVRQTLKRTETIILGVF